MSAAAHRMRVLMTTDAVGGVWQYATDLARELGRMGVATVLAVLGPAPNDDQRALARSLPGTTLVETGLSLDWLARDPAEVRVAAAGVADLARRYEADLVQLNQPALAAEVDYPAPVVAVSHSCLATWWAAVEGGAPPADFAWRAELHGAGLRAAERMICPSRAFAAATQLAYGLAEAPTAVHNGRAPLIPSNLPMEDVAFTAGRLWDRSKDAATLDRAAARARVPILAAGSLIGPNGDRPTLTHVRTLGAIAEEALLARLAARPVFVSTARYEPFGLAVLEAAAAGCALVLADTPTFRELWNDAATFVPLGDDAGFAAAIDHLVGTPALRLAQGERARAAAVRYTPERTAAAMTAIYAQLAPVSVGQQVAA